MADHRPSPLACIPCRRRHVKCDARMPICTRCHNSNSDCRYVRSRRGLRNRSSPDPPPGDVDLLPDFTTWLNNTIDLDPEFLSLDPNIDLNDVHSDPIQDLPPSPPAYTPAVAESEPLAHDAMIQLYYHHFHRSHPILLPRRSLASSLCQHIPAYITHIMRYIGSHYYPQPGFSDAFRAPAYTALSAPNDGFKVQGLLLLAILEHSYGHEETARKLLKEAIQLACHLNMTSPSFARSHSRASPILEESWRRTYWELVVVEGLISAFGGGPILPSYKWINDEMQLPCDEKAYNFEQLKHPKPSATLSTLPNFDLHHISPFTHRILATQDLRAVLQVTQSLDPDTELQTETLDARLATSLMRLPSSLPEHDTATVDEMVFQTLMITYLSLIYLHHPHSTIRLSSYHPTTTTSTLASSSSTTSSSSCTRLRTLQSLPLSTTTTHIPHHDSPASNTHSQKLLRAADLLSNLATLPSTVLSRTPFFTCGLAIAAVVHVAALAGGPPSSLAIKHEDEKGVGREQSLKARIELGVGALQVLGRAWTLARRVRGEMVEVYRGRC
ncbi:C6 transcription factor [Aspergillus piperis CBS 112811]|uniref:C6 transcription factor n=1 Tax=Aspergillus piperis CBS 112811 TaxID=1448313 RepID=A0A8G1RFF9_9EURO|nr:C6 transcription factor [Aspergillus piperis CBS 112811]RAH62320.1 C6 transcription factor [Aspergillus piperis CBS 112811]